MICGASLLLLSGLAASPSPVPSPAGPPEGRPRAEVERRVETYAVSGSTQEELLASLRRNRPRIGTTLPTAALTRWSLGWRYRAEGRERCGLVDLQVKVEVVITLPEWKDRQGAPAALGLGWDRFRSALEEHEDGHARIGAEAGEAVLAALGEVPAQPDCDRLKEEADRRARQIIATFHEKEVGYDLRTGHGATQGTRFP